MIAVLCQRPPADRQGPNITEGLLSTVDAALERGRNEIDHNATSRVLVELSGPYRQWIAPGQLVEYRGRRGSFKAKATRFSLSISRSGETDFTADFSLELEREP